jgi:hypothetical protein
MTKKKRAFVPAWRCSPPGPAVSFVALAAGGGNLQQAGNDLTDRPRCSAARSCT